MTGEACHKAFSNNDLAPELLAMVFNCGIETDAKGSNEAALALPHTVAAVCRSWRRAAITATELWTNIVVNLSKERHPSLPLIATSIKRSAERTLDIVISVGPEDDTDTRDRELSRMSAVMGLLLPHINRWRSVQISVHHFASFVNNLSHTHRYAGKLVDISLYCTSLERVRRTTSRECYIQCPALQSLNTDPMTFIRHGMWISSIDSLSSLTVAGPDDLITGVIFYELLDKIRSFKSLRSLSMTNIWEDLYDDGTQDLPLYLGALEEVAFGGMDGSVVAEFFKATETPSLKVLRLSKISNMEALLGVTQLTLSLPTM